jgi:hypothetical protein
MVSGEVLIKEGITLLFVTTSVFSCFTITQVRNGLDLFIPVVCLWREQTGGVCAF